MITDEILGPYVHESELDTTDTSDQSCIKAFDMTVDTSFIDSEISAECKVFFDKDNHLLFAVVEGLLYEGFDYSKSDMSLYIDPFQDGNKLGDDTEFKTCLVASAFMNYRNEAVYISAASEFARGNVEIKIAFRASDFTMLKTEQRKFTVVLVRDYFTY